MNTLEFLDKYDKAASIVKQFYLDKMLETLDTDDLPDNFKEFVKAQDFDNLQIAKLIDGNPRTLFDVFDQYELFVETLYMEHMFHYTITNGAEVLEVNVEKYKTRIECDRAAIEACMKRLNESL